MGREESKEYILNLIRVDGDNDNWIKAEYVLYLVDRIYDEFESITCKNCKFGLLIDNREELLCGNAKCEDINELGQYVVRPTFGCNEFKEK